MTKQVTITLNEEVYEESKAVLKEMGLTFSGGIEMYLRAIVREQAIPFPLKTSSSRVEYALVSLSDNN